MLTIIIPQVISLVTILAVLRWLDNRMEKRLGDMDQKMEKRFDAMDQKMEKRFESIHQTFRTISSDVGELKGQVNGLSSQVANLNTQVNVLNTQKVPPLSSQPNNSQTQAARSHH